MTGAFISIALSVKPKWRAAYFGVVGVTFGTASVIGPVLGGVLTDQLNWKWCFWYGTCLNLECHLTICRISLPIGVLAAIILACTIETPLSTESTRIPLKEKIISLDLGGSLLVLGE